MLKSNKYKKALTQLLYCFNNLDGWAKIVGGTNIDGKPCWINLSVDDTTNDVIKYVKSLLKK